jgi:hypothetical protein
MVARYKIKHRYFGGWHFPSKKQLALIQDAISVRSALTVWKKLSRGESVIMKRRVLGLEYRLKIVWSTS